VTSMEQNEEFGNIGTLPPISSTRRVEDLGNEGTEAWQRTTGLGQTQELSQTALKPRQAGAGELAKAPMLGIGLLGSFFSRGVGDSCASR
jgi:hypothetical protein